MELEVLENRHLRSQIKRLKNEIYELKNPKQIISDTLDIGSDINRRLNTILKEADEAMDRFNAKLRKESAKYAKQKQSKG